MGLLSGMEETLQIGENISEEIAAKNLLFGYIYCHVPVLNMLICPCPDGWTKNSCHIELDPHTVNKLIEIGAIKPVDHNVIHEQCNIRTPSHFVKTVAVPFIYCKCSEWVLNEYDEWYDKCVAAGWSGWSEQIEEMANNLKRHMIDYYDKNRDCYGIA